MDKASSIKRGEKIRILVGDLECADVYEGQVLEVVEVSSKILRAGEKGYSFSLSLEGKGWQRVEFEH